MGSLLFAGTALIISQVNVVNSETVFSSNEVLFIGEYDDNLVLNGTRWVVPGFKVNNVATGDTFLTGEYDDNLVLNGTLWEVPSSKVNNVDTRKAFLTGKYDDNLMLTQTGWVVRQAT